MELAQNLQSQHGLRDVFVILMYSLIFLGEGGGEITKACFGHHSKSNALSWGGGGGGGGCGGGM